MVAAAYDMVRLFIGPMAATPRGIDRVDLSYLRFFAEQYPHDFGGVLPTAWGFRWFEREFIRKWLERLERHWRESIDPEDDRVLQWVKRRLLDPQERLPQPAQRPSGERLRRIRDVLRTSGVSAGRSLVRSAPRGCVYVNVGQLGLSMEWLLAWLERRRDVRPVFMLHDVIPLTTPEFVSARANHYHCKMVDNAARFAAGLITTTGAARDTVVAELARRGSAGLPVATVPLPVAPPFLRPAPADRDLRGGNYFVVCGAIEPRKNHALLFNVWRELVAAHGAQAPRLVVVGFPGWGAAAILHQLAHSAAVRHHVTLACGLSTPGLRSLIANARALLMPSFAEGFGLPIVEALTLGTPVIASDLAAHREVGQEFAVYKDPIDGLGWRREIERFAFTDAAATARAAIAAGYRPFTGPQYFARIAPFLASIGAAPARRQERPQAALAAEREA